MLVTLAEETPVSEVIDTAFAIEDRAGVALGPVVDQRLLPPAHGRGRGELGRDPRRCERVPVVSSPTARPTISRTRPRSSRSATRCNSNRSNVCANGSRCPQIELPFVFNPDITRGQLDVLVGAFENGIGRL